MRFLITLLLFTCVVACSPKTRISLSDRESDVRGDSDFKKIRSEIRSELKQLKKTLQDAQTKNQILQDTKLLKSHYRALSRSIPPKGNKELLQQYCEVILGIISELEVQIERTYRQAQEDTFARLKRMDLELSSEFALRPWEKVAVIFKRK